jgi:hypothetical protein
MLAMATLLVEAVGRREAVRTFSAEAIAKTSPAAFRGLPFSRV